MKRFVSLLLAAVMMMPLRVSALTCAQITIPGEFWYVSPQVESPFPNASVPDGKVFYLGAAAVQVTQRGADSYEIALTCEFDQIEPMSIDEGLSFTPAVRIPVRIEGHAPGEFMLANGSNFQLVLENENADTAWLYLPLQKGGQEASCLFGLAGDPERVRIDFTYTDAAPNVQEDQQYYENPSFEVLACAGAQTGNFTARIDPAQSGQGASYNPQAALSRTGGQDAVTRLTYAISAADPQSRRAIFKNASYEQDGLYHFLQGSDAMALKVRALKSDGTAYPAGTLIEAVNLPYDLWGDLLGSTNKTVNTSGKAAYFLDEDGCFTLTVPGITVFAAAAAGLLTQDMTASLTPDAPDSMLKLHESFAANFSESMDAAAYNALLDALDGTENFIWASKWYIGRLGLQLTFGAQIDAGVLDLYFVNEPQDAPTTDSASVTLLTGDQMLLNTPETLVTAWISTDPQIAQVLETDDGFMLSAIAPGSALVFCVDGDSRIHQLSVLIEDAAPSYLRYAVTATVLNVRSERSTQSEILGTYKRNSILYGLPDERGEWILLFVDDTPIGYVSAQYVAQIE